MYSIQEVSAMTSFLGSIFYFVLGVVLLFIFITIGVNVGTIRKNIQSLYSFEHARALREGLITASGNIVTRTAVKPSIGIVRPRDEAEEKIMAEQGPNALAQYQAQHP